MNVLQPCPPDRAETFQLVYIYSASESSTEPIRLRTMVPALFSSSFSVGEEICTPRLPVICSEMFKLNKVHCGPGSPYQRCQGRSGAHPSRGGVLLASCDSDFRYADI